ncbi:MAG TPA: DHHA1 domain-containing protein [Gemmatales bacterium]|nr:DHHA1 domain-containing protein [Gemmatales bacterium]HMP59307.1 DHHA1 domain-containing protein [Gemmatales bacterium]
MSATWQPLLDLVASCRRLVLTTHMRPDGDGLGSMKALALALASLGKETRLVIPTHMPERYAFLDPEGQFVHFDRRPDGFLDGVDGLIVMDTGTWNQLGPFADWVRSAPVPRLVIDHHLTQDDLGGPRIVDTSAEATGRMAYEAIAALGVALSPAAATALFVAVAMDTGWFRHSNTTARTHELAAALVAAGATPDLLYQQLFEQSSLARLKLTGKVLDRLSVTASGLVAVSQVRLTDYVQTGALPPDSEDLVNFTLAVKDVKVGILLLEQPAGGVKVSLRSRCKLNVGRLAEQFGGGGHAAAAGAIVHAPIEEVEQRLLLKILPELEP